uniref:G-protein coupled receptors family 1 profile domain-containing protein n=1 Tax=Romanomermis culicivorax TaxID=13658 RepID=A0A915KRC1_ROMCU
MIKIYCAFALKAKDQLSPPLLGVCAVSRSRFPPAFATFPRQEWDDFFKRETGAGGIATYHIYMHLVEKSAVMKPFDCFKYAGTMYIPIHFSYWMVLLTSIDRSIAIFSPNFYKTDGHMTLLNKAVLLIICLEFIELFAFNVDNFSQEPIVLCALTSAMGIHTQFYSILVSTVLSTIPPLIYCVCFIYLLFQWYQKRSSTSADIVAVKRRLKNRVTWTLAFMATWQVVTIVIACTYSLLSYDFAYHGDKASYMFTGCLVNMNGTVFLLGNVIYLKKFRSTAAKVIRCKSLNSVANVN